MIAAAPMADLNASIPTPQPVHYRPMTKRDMVRKDYLPLMEVDARTCEVRADDMLLTCEPAKVLPLAQRYFLF